MPKVQFMTLVCRTR